MADSHRALPGCFSCVVDEAPRFHLDALRWFACLTQVAGVPAGDLHVFAVGGSTSEVLDHLAANGVTVRPVDPFDKRSPHCNKISGALALAGTGVEGHAVLCDTDTAILEDPRRLPVPPGAVAGKPVDAPVPPHDVLVRVFTAAGLDLPGPVVPPWGAGDRTVGGNLNGGVYVVPGELLDRLAPAWSRWASWLLDNQALLGEWSVYVDQVAMALTLTADRLPVFPLDVRWNTPTHDPTRIPAHPPVPAVLHYHEQVDGHGAILETGRPAIDRRIAAANRAIAALWERAHPLALHERWRTTRTADGHTPARPAGPPVSGLAALVGRLAAAMEPVSVTEIGAPGRGPVCRGRRVTHLALPPGDLAVPTGPGRSPPPSVEADIVVVHGEWLRETGGEGGLPVTVWTNVRRALVVSEPGARAPTAPGERLCRALGAAAGDAEIYPVPLPDGEAVLALRPPAARHPRDFTAVSLDSVSARHPDPLTLAIIRLCAWRTTTFYPDHAPRLWEYPLVADLLEEHVPAGSRLVDVGAGVTPLPPFLTQAGFVVDTVDPAPTTREWPPKPDWNEWDYLDYRRAGLAHRSWNRTLDQLPARRTYDAVYSVSVIEHLPAESRRSLLEEIARRVRGGGIVVLTVDLIRGEDSLWNRSRGLTVEDPALHGSFSDLLDECRAVGLPPVHHETVRGWGDDVEVDIGLVELRRA